MPSVATTLPSWEVTARQEFLTSFLNGFRIAPEGGLRVPIQGEMGRLLSRRLDAASAPALAHVLKEAVQGVQALAGPKHDFRVHPWELNNAWGGLPVIFDVGRRVRIGDANKRDTFSAYAPSELGQSPNLSNFYAYAEYDERGDLGGVHARLKSVALGDRMGMWVEQERFVNFFDELGPWDVNSYTTLLLSARLGFFAEHLQEFGNDFDSLTPAQQALMYTVYIFADLSKRNELPLWLTLKKRRSHSNTTYTLQNARDPKQVQEALRAIAKAKPVELSVEGKAGVRAKYEEGPFGAKNLGISVKTLVGQRGRNWAGFHALFDSALQAILGE